MIREERMQALLLAAEAHTFAGRLGQAAVAYQRILDRCPPPAPLHELAQARLASVHLAMNRAADALEHVRRAQAAGADEPVYQLLEGEALRACGQLDEASLCYYELLETPHHRIPALRSLAQLLWGQGDREGARRLMRRTLNSGADGALSRAAMAQFCDA